MTTYCFGEKHCKGSMDEFLTGSCSVCNPQYPATWMVIGCELRDRRFYAVVMGDPATGLAFTDMDHAVDYREEVQAHEHSDMVYSVHEVIFPRVPDESSG